MKRFKVDCILYGSVIAVLLVYLRDSLRGSL